MVMMTNSWKMGKKQLVEQLNAKGFQVSMDDIYTSSDACKQYMKEHKIHRPYFLVDDNVLKDFADDFQRRQNEDAVIVGLPSTLFDYRLLSKGMKYVRYYFNVIYKLLLCTLLQVKIFMLTDTKMHENAC